ncbi:MAG: dTDP-4-dehydrorhamnose 3,5-epimerase family protein [Phycisphaerae bacterium]|nr:dTDP-4-dehydrorhamnose 3,5-epimerase family protein [Phycisphaerae bacterium]
MKILTVRPLSIPAVKVIRFARFPDHRGYFTEPYRLTDFDTHPDMSFMKQIRFVQANESYSKHGVIRGLHFQWNPCMGKLVRTLVGHMVDIVLDIRKGSPTFGRAIGYDMRSAFDQDWGEWIWVPPGFAHGNFFPQDSAIEYFCSGSYSPTCEAGISPLATDIDWSLCDPGLKDAFDAAARSEPLMTDKDRNALTVAAWAADARSDHFVYGPC